ncbi:MAG: tetratricopeptide repeat protein [Candidatus Omnitrophica bacterium]|nr:tetratricopeptide repeat protein [Candidatus Omnitrophota bacterium]
MKLIAGLSLDFKRLFFVFSACLILFSFFGSNLSLAQDKKSITRLYSDYLKGLQYFEEGKYQQALEFLEKAKVKDPDSIYLRLKIAAALIRLEKIDQAETALIAAKKIAPDNLDISWILIFVYSLTDNSQKLEQEYESFLKKAHELKPKDVGISEYLAQFYFYKKQPQEAIRVYQRILEVNPKHVGALFWLGYLYDESGRRQEAIDTWKKGLAIDGSYAPILNSLGYLYAVSGENLDQAEVMLNKALEAEPDNGAYLDSLGWIYFKKGNLDKARKYLEEAIAQTKDPEIYEHLGDFYLKFGNPDKAIEYYREGLNDFPDSINLKEKLQRYGK